MFPDRALADVGASLAASFAGVFSLDTVHRYVRESYEVLHRQASAPQHLIVLTERFAADRLAALARADGLIVSPVPEVLFVCTHNAGRSQIAAALLRRHAGHQVQVRSAGSQPAAELEVAVVEVLAELDADVLGAYPKPITDEVVRAADVVVTMGCGDACPIYPGKRYLDWNVADPDGLPLDDVRAIRDDIDLLVQDLLSELFSQKALS